jgi:hypothetical protein
MSCKLQQKAGLIIGLFTFLLSFSCYAALSRPVIEEGKPTEIQVVGAILDVDKIDSTEQNFTLNFYSAYRWKDPRLAHGGPGTVVRDIAEIWNPRLTFITSQKHWTVTRDEVEISPEGVVTYRMHFFGSFSQPLDLHNFPHDRHEFRVPVVAAGYRPSEVIFMQYPGIDSFIAEELSVADWKINNMQGTPHELTLSDDLKLTGFVFSFEGKRLIHHYLIKTLIPLSLIVMMSWIVFWVGSDLAATRLSVAVTTVLTLIAYHIAMSGQMPKIPYLTDMDKFLFTSTLLVFTALIQVVITSSLCSSGKEVLARKINRTSRWLFPLIFFSTLGYSFFI